MSGLTRTAEDARTGRLLGALAVGLLGALYAAVSTQIALGVLFAAAALSSLAPRQRPVLGPAGQAAAAAAICAATALVVKLDPAPSGAFRGLLASIAHPTAIAAIVTASARLWLREAWGGDRATAGVGVLAVLACGSSRSSAAFPALSIAYLLGASLWLRQSGLVGADPLPSGRRDRWALAGLLALAGALSGGLALAVPIAHARVVEALSSGLTAQVGFQDGPLDLGSLEGLAMSDTIVARVFDLRGGRLLRGAVYQHYSRGRWSPTGLSFDSQRAEARPEGPSVEVRLEPVDVPRLLAPLGARALSVDGGEARADALGVLAPPEGRSPGWVRYQPGARDAFSPAPPEPIDLALPPDLAPPLRQISASWVSEGAAPAEAMAQLADRLGREHRYSLRFERGGPRDPVMAFLLEKGDGHCEYFASALALLGRAAGVPTRLAAGYRVSEWNPLGRYHVVRERNAHAWVEAWVEGEGWKSFDPSPRESLEVAGPTETSPLPALLDALGLLARRALKAALARPAALASLLALPLSFLLYREWRRGRPGLRAPSPLGPESAPLACLAPLLSALEARGSARSPSEPLEQLALRVEPHDPEGARLLRRYADLRYGGEGDERELSREIDAYASSPARG